MAGEALASHGPEAAAPRARSATIAVPGGPVERRERLRKRLGDAGASVLLVTHTAGIRYLTGFGEGGALLLGADGRDTLVTVPMNEAQARADVDHGVEVVVDLRPLEAARARLTGADTVLFEKERLSVAQLQQWERAGAPRLEGVSGWVTELRAVKSVAERETIARAAKIAVDAFDAVLPRIRPGVTELQVAARLEWELRERGCERFAFDTIVLFGERAALPHGEPGARRLRRGEVVLLDFGAVVDGYASDVSRTVACGTLDPRLEAAYGIVSAARKAAIETLHGGVEGRRVDAAAREVVAGAGYGPAFLHSLGHGIGLEVHEDPRLWKGNPDPVPTGAVVTLEPGIYIQGLGGIRIEDEFSVEAEGARSLAEPAPNELVVL